MLIFISQIFDDFHVFLTQALTQILRFFDCEFQFSELLFIGILQFIEKVFRCKFLIALFMLQLLSQSNYLINIFVLLQTLLLDLSFVPIDFFNLISDDLLLLCPDMLHLRNVCYFEWLIIFHYRRKRFFLRSLLFNGKLFWPESLLLIALLINNLDGAKLFGLFDGPHLVVGLPAERLWAVNHLEFPRGLVFIVTGRWISGKGCSLVFSCELWLVLVLAAVNWELRFWTLRFNRLLVLFS